MVVVVVVWLDLHASQAGESMCSVDIYCVV